MGTSIPLPGGTRTLGDDTVTRFGYGAPVVGVQNLDNLAHRDDDALVVAYVPFFHLGRFSRTARGDLDVGRARLAAAALAEHPAQPGVGGGGAPA